jgi:hypothetical protein
MSNSDSGCFIVTLLTVGVIVFLIFTGSSQNQSTCQNDVAKVDATLPYRWSIGQGCSVEVERGVWIGLDGYKWYLSKVGK